MHGIEEARNLAKRVKDIALNAGDGDPTALSLACELANATIELAAAADKLDERLESVERALTAIGNHPALI